MKLFAEALNAFYRGRRVLVTGHTGFKGSWLLLWLRKMGAETVGIALPATSSLSMFSACRLGSGADRFIDVRDRSALRRVFQEANPEIVFHLAAQALVSVAYERPAETFETNVIGTLNVLECVRSQPGVRAAVMVTSDKCYQNVEQIWGYREDDRLGGSDPYTASKAAAEMAVTAYSHSYFAQADMPNVASVRAGNVVGGGDWSQSRLIPDCIRGLRAKAPISLRSPESTRPWQFVLEPLGGYLLLAKRLTEDGKTFQGAWNFGSPVDNTKTVNTVARAVLEEWGEGSVEQVSAERFHENSSLQLDCTKAAHFLGWRSILNFGETMRLTAQWYRHQFTTGDACMREFSLQQLSAFEERLSQEFTI